MSQLDAAREDVLVSAAIELERMLGVLANTYSNAKFHEHALYLPTVETRLRACLKDIGRATPPPPRL